MRYEIVTENENYLIEADLKHLKNSLGGYKGTFITKDVHGNICFIPVSKIIGLKEVL